MAFASAEVLCAPDMMRAAAGIGVRLQTTPTVYRSSSHCAAHALVPQGAAGGLVSSAPDTELFPFAEPFNVDGRALSALEVLEVLRGALSDSRVDKMLQVCAQRTFDIVPVVEGLYDLGNIAAVSRSCDGALRWHSAK